MSKKCRAHHIHIIRNMIAIINKSCKANLKYHNSQQHSTMILKAEGVEISLITNRVTIYFLKIILQIYLPMIILQWYRHI